MSHTYIASVVKVQLFNDRCRKGLKEQSGISSCAAPKVSFVKIIRQLFLVVRSALIYCQTDVILKN